MNFLEISLLILGVLLFLAGFIIPEKKEHSTIKDRALADEVIKESADAYFSKTDLQMQENIDEAVLAASNKLEREMEKISNEKLFSISEYTETVLKDINKNHGEVLFLYDMLNDKQQGLKDLSVQLDMRLRQINESLSELEETEHIRKPEVLSPEIKKEEIDANESAPKNRNEFILSLHQEGYENLEIARRLNVGVGEVKLVVDLFSA